MPCLRDMKAFNLALLAKQAWRVLTEPDSLLHLVYRHLYFTDGDFLRAKNVAKASFSWRSILAAKEILCEGLKWRVGDGQMIKVFGDRWLFGKSMERLYPMPSALNLGMGLESKVSTLVVPGQNCWNEELLSSLFSAADSRAIMQVPLGELRIKDSLMWPFTRDGCLSVKSAYHFIIQKWQDSMPGCSSRQSSIPPQVWKKLWGLVIADKIKIFGWRLCLNSLSSYLNLVKRGLEVDNYCFVCGAQDGDLLHLFITCPVAIQIWALSNLWSEVKPLAVSDISDWVVSVLSVSNDQVAGLFLVILWSIWRNRNESLFEGRKSDPMRLWNGALHSWQDFKNVNRWEGRVTCSQQDKHWSPPPHGVLKVNVDASAGGVGNQAVGWVVRDSNENFIEAVVRRIPHWEDIELLEALALKEACRWCDQHSCQQVIIESDALNVVNMSRAPLASRTASLLVQETTMLIGGRDWRIAWQPRSCNSVAHLLVSSARNSIGTSSWSGVPPDFLVSTLLEDQSSCMATTASII